MILITLIYVVFPFTFIYVMFFLVSIKLHFMYIHLRLVGTRERKQLFRILLCYRPEFAKLCYNNNIITKKIANLMQTKTKQKLKHKTKQNLAILTLL